MSQMRATAPGKIILSGEYAVVFGFSGIAIPSRERVAVSFAEGDGNISMQWMGIKGDDHWERYVRKIIRHVETYREGKIAGMLTINNQLPLGKGMGSSTAFVIAISRCFLGEDCMEQARAVEDIVNPGHSGIDFAVIWRESPIIFHSGRIEEVREQVSGVRCQVSSLRPRCGLGYGRQAGVRLQAIYQYMDGTGFTLIDTGEPNETTAELVAWVSSCRGVACYDPTDTIRTTDDALAVIGRCTERLLSGEDLQSIIRDHHRAQVALGVVPQSVQELIKEIESKGGAAKVIGAGGKTGGGGMVMRYLGVR